MPNEIVLNKNIIEADNNNLFNRKRGENPHTQKFMFHNFFEYLLSCAMILKIIA